MGRFKDFIIQMQEDDFGVQLAKYLDVPYFDLSMQNYEIHENRSNDDAILYSYTIEFDENTNKEFLKKLNITGNTIDIPANAIDTTGHEYYEDQFEAITTPKNYYTSFMTEIKNIEKLTTLKIENIALQEILLRQVFISIFGTLETFLSDTFINLTLDDEKYLKNFVQTYPEFQQRKFELKDVFEYHNNIKDISTKVMLDIIYHDLPKVKKMYAATFGIEFPELKSIMPFVSMRHDLVHRNGKTKQGEKIQVENRTISDLIKVTVEFVDKIAKELKIHNLDYELPF